MIEKDSTMAINRGFLYIGIKYQTKNVDME